MPDLERYRPALLALQAQITALTVELEAVAPEKLPQGFGKLTHEVTTREVCDWSRFHNRRQVSSYTGLCPGEYSSGGKRVPGSVTKHGNPRLRAALVELAWRLVRFQPQYPPVKKRIALLAKGAKATGAARKKAIVARPFSCLRLSRTPPPRLWPGSSPSISGGCTPAAAPPPSSGCKPRTLPFHATLTCLQII